MVREPDATVIDMTPDGAFVQPPRPLFGLRASTLAIAATALATVVVALVMLVWVTVTLLPFLVIAGLGIYLLRRLRSSKRRSRFPHNLQRRF